MKYPEKPIHAALFRLSSGDWWMRVVHLDRPGQVFVIHAPTPSLARQEADRVLSTNTHLVKIEAWTDRTSPTIFTTTLRRNLT